MADKPKKFKNNLLFDYLGNILRNKSLTVYKNHIDAMEFESSFSPFMIVRYLSMHPTAEVRKLVLDNQMYLERLPARVLYKYLLIAVPRQTNTFIKYIK